VKEKFEKRIEAVELIKEQWVEFVVLSCCRAGIILETRLHDCMTARLHDLSVYGLTIVISETQIFSASKTAVAIWDATSAGSMNVEMSRISLSQKEVFIPPG
jgi:hypothetical protein